MNPIKDKISKTINSYGPLLSSVSRFLYENPETAYEEYKACAWLTNFLSEQGFDVETGVGGVETSFLARPKGVTSSGPVVAFLAEYDALPKIGHGCGHNLIAAASLGAALALKNMGHDLPGSYLVCGTPAEEGGGGKARLAEAGVFEGVDFSLLFHPGHLNLTGDNTLGRIKAKVEFFGRTAHAATAPEMGLNALDAILGAFNNINAFRQQMAADGRIHGIITHGGDAPNIIPDYTAGLFYVRAANRAYLREMFDRFTDCCQGAARGAGCRCQIEIMPPSLDPVKRNMTMEKVCRDNMEYVGLPIGERDRPSGSTDLGNLSQIMPTLQLRLGICDEEIPIHSVRFAEATMSERGQKALLDGAKILAMTVVDYLSSPEIQRRATEEFISGAA